MSETTHTPTPWEAQERDNRERGIAIIAVYPDAPKGRGPTRGMVAWVGQAGANFGKPAVQKANADFIITAVNHHAALVEMVRYVYDTLATGAPLYNTAKLHERMADLLARIEEGA